MARKRELTEASVRDVVVNVIGYDDPGMVPSIPGIMAPVRFVVDEVIEELGWSLRNRHARICVSSILQHLMWAAKRSA